MPSHTPFEQAKRSVFDRVRPGAERLFGISGELDEGSRTAGLRGGLIGAGTSLLKSTAPVRASERGSTLSNIAEAIEAAQAGSAEAISRRAQAGESQRQRRSRDILAGGAGDFESVVRMLLVNGDLKGASTVAGIAQALAQGESQQPTIKTIDLGDKWQVISPITGEPIRTYDKTQDGQDRLKTVNTWYGNFAQRTTDHAKTALNFRKVETAADGGPAGDLTLLFGFMKLIDPTSVVRESEFATAAATGSVPERLRGVINKVLSGERLTDTQRADFLQEARDIARETRADMNSIIREMGTITEPLGLKSSDYTFDYFADINTERGGRPAETGDALDKAIDEALRLRGR